jgi:hypothetical protein
MAVGQSLHLPKLRSIGTASEPGVDVAPPFGGDLWPYSQTKKEVRLTLCRTTSSGPRQKGNL